MKLLGIIACLLLLAIERTRAQASVFSDGDTAWMLSSSALVLIMTPGLAFFYGGLVREKNMVNTLMMSFVTIGIITVHWTIIGYSFAFGPGIDELYINKC